MISERRLVFTTSTLLYLLAVTGCVAGFRAGKLEEVQGWPPPALTTSPSISLEIEGLRSGSTGYFMGAEAADKIDSIARAYRDSELFSQVTVGEANSDFQARVSIREVSTRPSGTVFIDFLFIFPAHTRSLEYKVETTFSTASREPVSVVHNESVEVWAQLLLTFIYPLTNPARAERVVLYDITRQTILDARKAGVFSQ